MKDRRILDNLERTVTTSWTSSSGIWLSASLVWRWRWLLGAAGAAAVLAPPPMALARAGGRARRLVARAAPFLSRWLESYRDYRPQLWDYNSCNVSTALAQSSEGRGQIHLAPELAPLPRYSFRADAHRHLEGAAPVAHLTGFSKPWRYFPVMGQGLLSIIAQRTLRAAEAQANASTPLQRACLAKLAGACWARGVRC